jgi:Cof subfamily protein (haloacid dehalogenase superfamily)
LKTPRYRLLVIDVDGTLINSEGEITPGNLHALERARDSGVHIALCTGRSVTSCRRYLERLGLDSYHIFFDGAVVGSPSTGRHIYAEAIEPPLVREMIEFAAANDIDIELSTVDRYFSPRETWSTDIKRRYFDIETFIGDLTGLWEREKIVRGDLIIRTGPEKEKAGRFTRYFDGRLQFTEAHTPRYPDVTFINATALGMSKGRALEALAAHLGISLGEVMAVGDWLNDIPLLRTAGLGVAMGNAHEELKKIADYVTGDVEDDGLAAAVDKFLL